MKCFYHNDLDGECSAAIVKKAIGTPGDKYYPINYNMDFPFEIIDKREKVIIVDFSLQKDGEFKKLLSITQCVTWIDHHKTAIEKHMNMKDLLGIRKDGVAGCQLTWNYFFPDKDTPMIVKYLADYDIWKFEYGIETKLIQEGMKLEKTNPENPQWNGWFNNSGDTAGILNKVMGEGNVAIRYRDNYYEKLIKSFSFMVEFEGYSAIACNSGAANSQLFDSVTEDYDIMMPFVFDGNQWTVSIYTKKDDIDVSEIAKKYGGGGHKQAAGFQCKELPFKIF